MSDILVVDDEEVLARTICQFLNKRGFTADYAVSIKDAMPYVKDETPLVAFVDFRIGRESGLDLLARIRERNKDAVVVMMTGHGDVEVAVNAMKGGARDFLSKPVPLEVFAEMAARTVSRPSALPSRDVEPPATLSNIVGRSRAAIELRSTIQRITSATAQLSHSLPAVLITGESGTGKDLVARALHASGQRSDKPFVSVNCASIPSELVESELFGHEKGAFTDAKSSHAGLFESANGGVLFLDEIGDMPLTAQAKLLRVLEERTVRRVGSVESRPINFWLIAATNRNLADLVAEGSFRGDLMFRLQVLWVDVPPLRERESDILLLSEHFSAKFATQYGKRQSLIGATARAQLIEHRWPGNIRELRNVIERATILANGEQIEQHHIVVSAAGKNQMGDSLEDMEVQMLRQALNKTNGNVTRAAANLGISRDTMRYRIEKFKLDTRV